MAVADSNVIALDKLNWNVLFLFCSILKLVIMADRDKISCFYCTNLNLLNRYFSGCNHVQQLSLKFWKIETTSFLKDIQSIIKHLGKKDNFSLSSHNPERIIYSPIKQMANWTPITPPLSCSVYLVLSIQPTELSAVIIVLFSSLMLLLTSTLTIWTLI